MTEDVAQAYNRRIITMIVKKEIEKQRGPIKCLE